MTQLPKTGSTFDDPIYRVEDAAPYLNCATSTLSKWRMNGCGPKYSKMGRIIVYRKSWLDEFIDSKAFASDSEYEV